MDLADAVLSLVSMTLGIVVILSGAVGAAWSRVRRKKTPLDVLTERVGAIAPAVQELGMRFDELGPSVRRTADAQERIADVQEEQATRERESELTCVAGNTAKGWVFLNTGKGLARDVRAIVRDYNGDCLANSWDLIGRDKFTLTRNVPGELTAEELSLLPALEPRTWHGVVSWLDEAGLRQMRTFKFTKGDDVPHTIEHARLTDGG